MTRAAAQSNDSRAEHPTNADRSEQGTQSSAAPTVGALSRAQNDRLASLLADTSRTFALSIPLLDEPLRGEVTIAYLLFRIADTIEDEVAWSRADKARALRVFSDLLTDPDFSTIDPALIESMASAEVAHAGYARLMADTVFVLECFAALDAAPRAAIATHLSRTASGMALQIEADAAPADISDAQEYCYAVAGIVGELCTELFVLRNENLTAVRDDLMALAPKFGEGLQLVNILRDETDDAVAGRRFIPDFDATTDCRSELTRLAARDLHASAEYVRNLESNGAKPGTVAFNALNVALAFETLALVANAGPGAKLSRGRVAEMLDSIGAAVQNGASISRLLDRSAACIG